MSHAEHAPNNQRALSSLCQYRWASLWRVTRLGRCTALAYVISTAGVQRCRSTSVFCVSRSRGRQHLSACQYSYDMWKLFSRVKHW